MRPCGVGKDIVSMTLDKFSEYLDYVEEDAIWCLFNIKNVISEKMERIYI